MKTSCKIPFIVIALTAIITSCKKDPNNNAFTGTWHQTKLHLYGIGTEKYDTTYLQPFTIADYIKIAGDNVTVSVDHYYYPNIDSFPKVAQQITAQVSSYNYADVSGKLVLTPKIITITPGGFVITDTLSVNKNTMLMHAVSYGHGGTAQAISDAYFIKQ